MVDLQIQFPDPLNEFAMAQVSSGRFADVNDYLQTLVRADENAQRAAAELSRNPRLAVLLGDGLNSGEGRRWSAAVLRELKQQVADRAAGK